MESKEIIMQLLPRLATAWGRQTDQLLLERFGIGVAQHKILALLQRNAGTELGQAQLARSLRQTEAAVSRQIELLSQRGLLASRINPRNRRQHLTTLTPKGTHLMRAVETVLEQHTELLLAKLAPKQRKQLAELLSALRIAPQSPQ